jgi:hypothetical protein
LQFLVSIHNAKDKAVRFRACQLIAGVMSQLREDMELDDALWQALQDALLFRCRDKIAVVRAMAATAMVRLQNNEDPQCPVVAEYVRLMKSDAVAAVREAALSSICITEATLPLIMQRGRDVSSGVRKQARIKVVRVLRATSGDGDGDGDATQVFNDGTDAAATAAPSSPLVFGCGDDDAENDDDDGDNDVDDA